MVFLNKRLLTAALVAPLVLGLALIPTAFQATGVTQAERGSAHTGNLTGTAACNASDGSGSISWVLNNDYNEPMVVTTSDDAAIPVGTTVAATGGNNHPDTKVTLTENIAAPAAGVSKTAHLQFTWTGDGFQQPQGHGYTQAYTSTKVSSDCKVPTPNTATASLKNVVAMCTPNVNGHSDNSADLAGSTGVTFTYQLPDGTTGPLSAGHFTPTVGTITVYAHAPTSPLANFTDGSRTLNLGTLTFPNPASLDCRIVVTPVAPAMVQAKLCGAAGSVTPINTPGVVYTVVSFDPTTGNYEVSAALASTDYKFAENAQTSFKGSVGPNVTCPTVNNNKCTTTTSSISTPAHPNGWAPDDKAGIYTVAGYELKASPKENLYHVATGLLSSFAGGGYVVLNKAPGTASASYQLRIYSNGTGQFNSVVWEPANNNLPIDFSGTVTSQMLLNGKWWLTHPNYANGVAPQSHPETLDTILAQIPFATMAPVLSYGVNIGSGGTPGGDSVVSQVSGFCNTTTFGFDTIVTPPAPVIPGPTCTAIGGPLPELGVNGAYDRPLNGPGKYTATYTAPFGETYASGLTVSYNVVVLDKLAANNVACQTEVTPVNPTATDVVCKSGSIVPGTFTVPSTTGVTYLKDGVAIVAGVYTAKSGETVTLTAQPADDTFKLASADTSWTWSKTFATVVCFAGHTLAFTGSNSWPLAGTGLLLLAAGGVLLAIWLVRRRPGGAHV